MPFVWLDYRDGQYHPRILNDAQVVERQGRGLEVRYLEVDVLEAYVAWTKQGAVFQALFRAFDNELRRTQGRPPGCTCHGACRCSQ